MGSPLAPLLPCSLALLLPFSLSLFLFFSLSLFLLFLSFFSFSLSSLSSLSLFLLFLSFFFALHFSHHMSARTPTHASARAPFEFPLRLFDLEVVQIGVGCDTRASRLDHGATWFEARPFCPKRALTEAPRARWRSGRGFGERWTLRAWLPSARGWLSTETLKVQVSVILT